MATLKIFSQDEWYSLLPSEITDEVCDVLRTSTNPEHNDVAPADCPEDAVCISDESLADLRARADWLGEEGDDDLANKLVAFVHRIESIMPSRELVVKALVSEGKA